MQGTSSLRRGLKCSLALGATASLPVLYFITNQNQKYAPPLEQDKSLGGVENFKALLQDRVFAFKRPRAAEEAALIGSAAAAAALPPPALESDLLEAGTDESDPPTLLLAKKYHAQLAAIRSGAEAAIAAPLPATRFTDAELMRYAIHHGLLRARDDAGRRRALLAAAAAAAETASWLHHAPFVPDAELARFDHLVWWAHPSSEARAVLYVDIGRAVKECRGREAEAFAAAVVTHVEKAVRRLRDAPEGHDRVDVVMYAAGTSALSASRAARVLTSVVTTLSHHYPGRLHQLTMVDLPRVLTWLLTGAKRLVHGETARKMVALQERDLPPGRSQGTGDGGDGAASKKA